MSTVQVEDEDLLHASGLPQGAEAVAHVDGRSIPCVALRAIAPGPGGGFEAGATVISKRNASDLRRDPSFGRLEEVRLVRERPFEGGGGQRVRWEYERLSAEVLDAMLEAPALADGASSTPLEGRDHEHDRGDPDPELAEILMLEEDVLTYVDLAQVSLEMARDTRAAIPFLRAQVGAAVQELREFDCAQKRFPVTRRSLLHREGLLFECMLARRTLRTALEGYARDLATARQRRLSALSLARRRDRLRLELVDMDQGADQISENEN